MPWKETDIMEERRRFINAVLEGIDTFQAVCEHYNISTKTGYKWLARFKADGYNGLQNHNKRPLTHPSRLAEDAICDLVATKMAHPTYGPKKIQMIYTKAHSESPKPSLSSVNRILKRAGLVKPQKRRKTTVSGRLTSKVAVTAPNDLWTMDFKGWWRSKDHVRIEPLTLRDDFSRYLLVVEHLENNRTESVKAALTQAFKQYGLPAAIKSDNGTPFAAKANILGMSKLTAWLISLGITITRSRPGCPQDNGGHERMHRDLKEAVQVRFRGNADQYQAELDQWKTDFNEVRPHEALDMKRPADIFVKSTRKYPGDDLEFDYPSDFMLRKVRADGHIKVFSHTFFLTTALAKCVVGLKVIDSHKIAVYFTNMLLGSINLEVLAFKPLKTSEDSL
jgi:putative transposase